MQERRRKLRESECTRAVGERGEERKARLPAAAISASDNLRASHRATPVPRAPEPYIPQIKENSYIDMRV